MLAMAVCVTVAEEPVQQVFLIDANGLWEDGDGLHIRFAEEFGEPRQLDVFELHPVEGYTKFRGFLGEKEVAGQFTLVTSALEEGGPRDSVDVVTTLTIEIIEGESVTTAAMSWQDPSSFPPDGGGYSESGYVPPDDVGISRITSTERQECKCTTGYLYLCPDRDCDNAETCNNDTGVCELITIWDGEQAEPTPSP